MSREGLWGRTGDLAPIRATDEGVVLVVGDSGIGKSELLAELGHGWGPTDLVAFPSVLGQLQGSLQAGIADAISGCLVGLADADPNLVRKVWHGITKIVDKASSAGAKEAMGLLLARVFKGIESKLGPEAASSARAMLKDVLISSEDDLHARLRAISSPDLGTILLALISEVSSLASSRVILLFDRGELLADLDLALLGELASRSTDAFLLVVTMNSHSPGLSPKLATLETRDATRYDLAPLTSDQIHQWLRTEGIPQSEWAAISRRSAGYPFFIAELIAMSRDGKLGGPLGGPNGFDALLMESWRSLAPTQQSMAMRLACFPDPPSQELISALTGGDELQWATDRLSLRDSRVFVKRPDGTLWFHDRRRDFIWTRLMEPDDRAAVADAVIHELRKVASLATLNVEWLLVALPGILRAGGPEVVNDDYLVELPKASPEELAIMFALVELREPGAAEGQAVETNAVVRHALSRLGLPSDPVKALETAASRGFVISRSDQSASVTVAIVPSILSLAALMAEMAFILGRTPTPSMGSASFDLFIRPLAGNFLLASISVGEGSLRTHRDALVELQRRSTGSHNVLVMPSLGIVYRVDDQAVTATIVFANAADRTAAKHTILNSQTAGVESDVEVIVVRELPPARVTLARLVRILKDQSGDPVTMSPIQRVRERVRLADAIGNVLRPDEASAVDWFEPLSVVVDEGQDAGWSEVRLRGGPAATVVETSATAHLDLWGDPLIELKLRRDGYILPTQRVEAWAIHAGSPLSPAEPPLKEVADELEKRTKAYNDRLARIPIPVTEDELERMLASSLRTEEELTRTLVGNGVIAAPLVEDPTSLYVYIQPSTDGPMFDDWRASTYEFRDGKGEVRVRVLGATDPMPEYLLTSTEAAAHNLPSPELQIAASMGYADHILASLLGLEFNDITLPRPSQLGGGSQTARNV